MGFPPKMLLSQAGWFIGVLMSSPSYPSREDPVPEGLQKSWRLSQPSLGPQAGTLKGEELTSPSSRGARWWRCRVTGHGASACCPNNAVGSFTSPTGRAESCRKH